MFWQLTIDASEPARLAWFWARALGYQPVPPAGPDTTWHRHYRARLGGEAAFDDRIFDPAGAAPAHLVPESAGGQILTPTTALGCADIRQAGRDGASAGLSHPVTLMSLSVARPSRHGRTELARDA